MSYQYIPEYTEYRMIVEYDTAPAGNIVTGRADGPPQIEIVDILIDGKQVPLWIYETLKKQHEEDWITEIRESIDKEAAVINEARTTEMVDFEMPARLAV